MTAANERRVHVATLQMDVQPAHTDLRLYRADQLIQDAVQLGAELVVLPELFNTGYVYSNDNFQRAERAAGLAGGVAGGAAEGSTLTWMKRTARRMGIHLAGSLLLLDDGEIYNAMFIIAPDGRTWRYDKSYPWGWERGYFRENKQKGAQRAVIADTALGRLGMLVCWDAGHPEMWRYYAGYVNMMVICSSPPRVTDPTFCLPPDIVLAGDRLGALWASRKDEASQVFGAMLDEQARWLGVPVANSVGCGTFESRVPNGTATLLGLVSGAPGLVRYLPRAGELTVRSEMVDACRIVSGEGKTLAHRSQARGEGFAIAEVTLPERRPLPQGPQPDGRLSHLSYFVSDTYLPRSMHAIYEHGLKQIRH